MNISSISSKNTITNTETTKAKSASSTSFESYLGESEDLDAIFQKAANKYGVDVNLLKSIAKAESNFNANATSYCGAQGIMQLMPSTAKSLGVTDGYDAEQNIMGGAKYIASLLDKYDGDVKLALAGYNAGPGNVAKYGGVPPFKETQNYVTKVMGYYNNGSSTSKTSSTTSSSSTAYEAASKTVRPSAFQQKRAAQAAANTSDSSASTTTDTSEAVSILNTINNSSSSQLSAYLDALEASGQAEDVNDVFSYEEYLKFLDIFFEEDENEDEQNTNSQTSDASIAKLQMSSSVASMLRGL